MKREERLKRIEELVSSGEDLGSFSAARMEISELLFKEMKTVLNKVHDMNASLRFWKLVVEDHLLADLLRKEVLRMSDWDGKPELFAIVNFKNIPTLQEKLRNIAGHFQRYLQARKLNTTIDNQLKKNRNIYVGFNDLPVTEAGNENSTKIDTYFPFIFGIGDVGKRKKLNEIADQYDHQFLRNLVKRIPRVYIENFEKFYGSIQVHDPAAKTFHVHRTYSLFETMMIAKYSENGSKLIWYQHGCYYGEVIHKYRGYFEHSTGDLFRTWGYKDHEIDEPWSAYRLEAFKRKMPKQESEITFDLMICYPAIGGHNKTDIVRNTDILLGKIDKIKFKNIIARPRPVNSRVKASSQLDFINSEDVTIAPDTSSIAGQVAASKIVFQMRVPSTNFLECIYCDQPVIGLLDNEQPTEIIKPHYEFFMEIGVLHKNIESAVEFLNNVMIDQWWKNTIEDPRYQKYKRLFANSVSLRSNVVL